MNAEKNLKADQKNRLITTFGNTKNSTTTISGSIMSEVGVSLKQRRLVNHFKCSRDRKGDLWMTICLDINRVIERSRLLERGLTFTHLTLGKGKVYGFDSITLEKGLAKLKRAK